MPRMNVRVRLLFTLSAWVGLAGGILAQPILETPNGNPTGPASAFGWKDGIQYRVDVVPANAQLPFPEDLSLDDVLGAQGYDAAHGWTINHLQMQGNFRLDQLQAWTNDPKGGASFSLHYQPQGTDPTGAAVHWIQMVATNLPAAQAQGIVNNSGLSWYIDDVGNPANNPFYDAVGGFANSTDFTDGPNREFSDNSVWRGYAFIATGDLDNKVLNIYYGVYWGFNDPVVGVPEPASLALCTLGTVVLCHITRKGSRASLRT